jgi:hypothetical protein
MSLKSSKKPCHLVYFQDLHLHSRIIMELFDFNEDVYMCCAYIPPSNSSHHALYDCELLRVLENSITTYSTKGKVVKVK